MKQRANAFCAAAVMWVSTFALIELSGRASAQGVPEQEVAQIRQFEQQYGPQFRILYKTELHFMRSVCQPTKQQFEKIAADGEPALKATIRKFAQETRNGSFNNQSDPRTPIADALVKVVRTNLSPEQAARYQKELDERIAARKRAAALNLVAQLDKALVLTPEQRAKLSKVLESKWNASWNDLQILMYGRQFFPRMPESEILPILTEAQTTVWRRMPKQSISFGGFNGLVQVIQLEEEVWDDVQPQKKPEREEIKAAVNSKETTKKVEKK
jgi:hypothetical protein